MNVVSTSPSTTEILYALGVEPAAVSHACDYPPAVEEKPRIDASCIDAGTSADRHEQVAATRADGHVYDVDADHLREAAPDLIVSQEVCGVCAVDTTVVDAVLSDLDVEPTVVGVNARRLEDVFESIRLVGEVTDTAERAETLVATIRAELNEIKARAASTDDSPRVAVVEWMDPVHVAANWVPELVDIAGGTYDLAAAGERSSAPGWAAVREYAPEVVVVAPCGYPVERTRERFEELADRDGWTSLPAVESGRVFAMDGASYLNRWTPRLVDATERLASVVHPGTFGEPPADVVPLEPTRS